MSSAVSSTVGRLAGLVALPHSVFALPFALVALLIANQQNLLQGQGAPLTIGVIALACLAVVFARTAAMGWNRIFDRHIDARNERTAGREIPAGRVSVRGAALLTLGAALGFISVTWLLGEHCLMLAPAVLAVLFFYSYTKRFTSFSHVVLGLCLALAPGGAWWILRPEVELIPVVLMGAVSLWVAGFDVLYSCQDVAFDTDESLHSIPVQFGVPRALHIARWLHCCCFLAFLAVGWLAGLGQWYVLGLSSLGVLLVLQHRLVSPDDLSKINHAFFTCNGVMSISYLVLVSVCL